jgi:hypothetical protein
MEPAKIGLVYVCAILATAMAQPRDPGVRSGAAGAGRALPGLTAGELAAFASGQAVFQEIDNVSDGLGLRF